MGPPAFIADDKRTSRSSSTRLNAVIPAFTDEDFISIDAGLGGVRLAMESAIKVVGEYKDGASNVKLVDLIRYTKVTEVIDMEQKYEHILKQNNIQVLCTGYGKECYHDPGETTVFRVELAPIEAAKDALQSYNKKQQNQQQQRMDETKQIVINILGGDDLMVHEATDAVQQISSELLSNSNKKCKIQMHSLCHSSFPLEYASVTVLAMDAPSSSSNKKKKQHANKDGGASNEVVVEEKMDDIAKSIAQGDVYYYQGKWWTVLDQDINTASDILEDGSFKY